MKMVALSCLLACLHSTALGQISIFPYSTDYARTLLDDPNGAVFDRTRNMPYYNVKHYGAVGDGVTDDTAAIQAAINACDAGLGGTIYLPNGIYQSGYLRMAGRSQRIVGESMGTVGLTRGTILRCNAACAEFLEMGPSTRLGLEHIYVDGNNLADVVVHLEGNITDTLMRQVTIEGATDSGINLSLVPTAANGQMSEMEFYGVQCAGRSGGSNITNMKISSNQALVLGFYNCKFSGEDVGTGSDDVDYGIDIVSGTVNMYSCFFVGQTINDIRIAEGNMDLYSCRSESVNVTSSIRLQQPGANVVNIFDYTHGAGGGSSDTLHTVTAFDEGYLTVIGGSFVDINHGGSGSSFILMNAQWSGTLEGAGINEIIQIANNDNPGVAYIPRLTGKYYPLSYGANVAVDASKGRTFYILANDANAFQIDNPTNAYDGLVRSFDIRNGHSSDLGTLTWDSKYKLNGVWSSPLTGTRGTITFAYDGTNWQEIGRGVLPSLTLTEDLFVEGVSQLGNDTNNVTISSEGALIPEGDGYVSGVSSFDVRDYGAVGDGSTDDTTAIQAAFDAADVQQAGSGVNRPIVYFPVSDGYAIESPVTCDTGINIKMDSELVYTGDANEIALTVGDVTKTNSLVRLDLRIRRSTQSNWLSEANIGVRLININTSQMNIFQAQNFTIGVQSYSYNAGCHYNNWILHYIYNNKYGLAIHNDTNGSSNDNKFYRGRFGCSSIDTSLNRYGIWFDSESDASGGDYYYSNGNSFYGPGFEMDDSGAGVAWGIKLDYGENNTFYGCRTEDCDGLAIIDNNSVNNLFFADYESGILSDTSLNQHNFAYANQNWGREPGAGDIIYNTGPVHKNALWSDGSTNTHIPYVTMGTSGDDDADYEIPAVTYEPNYISFNGSRTIGIFVKTTNAKRFTYRRDVEAGYGGRLLVQCYDSGGTVLTSGGGNHPYVIGLPAQGFTYNASYGGGYITGSDSNSDVYFIVGDDVDYMRVMQTGGSSAIRTRGFSLLSLDDGRPTTWTGIDEQIPGVNLGSIPPTAGTWGVGRMLLNTAQAEGTPYGWVCTSAGTPGTWDEIAFIGDEIHRGLQLGNDTNNVTVSAEGELTLVGDATVWDDLRVPASSAKRLGNSDPDWEVFQNGVYGLAFATNTDQEVFFTVQIPHSWKLGSDLDPHVHWSPSSVDTGDVTWALEYTIADITGTFGNTVTITTTDAGDGTINKHQVTGFADIDMSSYTDAGDVSIILMCRLYRDVDNGDDYADDAFLLEFDLHYEIDTMGSNEEASK